MPYSTKRHLQQGPPAFTPPTNATTAGTSIDSLPKPAGSPPANATAAGLRIGSLPKPALHPTVTRSMPTEISSSVSVFYNVDWDLDPISYGEAYTSRCIQMVERAAQGAGRIVNFVVTNAYWIDRTGHGGVDSFCWKQEWGKGCRPFNKQTILRFQYGMQACFQAAVDRGMSIAITPHLDDGLEYGGWRNILRLDPVAKHQNWSYYDITLRPLALALREVITPSTQVWFAMQGEMSSTIFYYPRPYITLIDQLKLDMVGGRADAMALLPNLYVGISTNFNKMIALLMDIVDPSQYLTLLPAALKPVLPLFDLVGIRKLYETADFIGISSYTSMTGKYTTSDLHGAVWQYDQELRLWGINIKDLMFNKQKPFILSEYGVGGGISQNGDVPATTADEAASRPFFGIFGVYNASTDPWQTAAPESVRVPVRDWRRKFYRDTARWLLTNGGTEYRIDGLYLWNLASWDVQAIHWASYDGAGGSYRDELVCRRIRAHNLDCYSESRRR